MGKWNRRWISRKKYQDAPPSPSRNYATEYNFRGVCENSMLSWEKKFCISVGIPWKKVVVAKRYMNSHDNVLKWNDSAGEESFYNAKKRFWAEINGLSCDAPPPDQGIYTAEVDWNPEIDPQLVLDLDRAYFNPDEGEKVDKVEIANRKVPGPASGWDDKHPVNGDNPWESSRMQSTGASKDISKGWNQWDNSRILENVDNPWKQSYSQGDGALKGSVWGGGENKSWGWNQTKDLDNNCGNRWAHGDRCFGSVKGKAWGEVGNNSCSWTRWETSVCASRNLNNSDNLWKAQPSRDQDRRWRESGDNSLGWKHWESQNNEPNHLESRRPSSGGRAFNGAGCRKREGPQQHTPRYKSSRFQNDDSGISHQWGNQRNHKFCI